MKKMKSINIHDTFLKQLVVVVATIISLSGCVTKTVNQISATDTKSIKTPVIQEQLEQKTQEIPVFRYGRYTFVEVGATSIQQSLLSQIIDINIPTPPKKQNASVADALRYILFHSGYELCDEPDIRIFERFTLPAVHRHLGPVTIRQALSVLVGDAWQLQVDDYHRKICFIAVTQQAIERGAPLYLKLQSKPPISHPIIIMEREDESK